MIYLNEILAREGPAPGKVCSDCDVREATWKCQDCLGEPIQCLHCFRINHRLHPFHRVETWTGAYFSPSWLWKVGTVIYLGHKGQPCPGQTWDSSGTDEPVADIPDKSHSDFVNNLEDPEGTPWDEEDFENDDGDIDDDDGDGLYNENELPDPPVTYLNGRRVLTYVHSNGIHQLPTSFCSCSGSPAVDIQLLQMGLFPCTAKDPQTGFTFAVLDDYILENLECKTSANHYYSKLRRMTSKAFPHKVKVSSKGASSDFLFTIPF